MFFIVGQTGVGKSEIAAEVACRCQGEIIGADAFQIYRGLDLLTAKPQAELRAKVPHHLIGCVPLEESFDAARFADAARRVASEIEARGKLALVAGGTGLYVRALTHELAEMPRADAALRAELETAGIEELHARLARLDPLAAAKIDAKNKRRLIRAVEVCVLSGKPFSSFREDWNGARTDDSPKPIRGVFLLRDRDELNARIDRRVVEMFRDGVIDEVRAIGPISATAGQVIGLKEILALLAGELSEPACVAQIQRATRRYAKRQLTWFRREPIFAPINLSALDFETAVRQIVEKITLLQRAAE